MNTAEIFARTVALSYRGIGYTGANPLVGCVIVENGRTLGEGWHQNFGGAHAEINALADARKNGVNLKNAELFVTLEPCAHQGKTPPCTQAIIQAGISQVSILFPDQNPQVNGQGIAALQKAGICVRTDFPEVRKQYLSLYEDFFFHIQQKRPFVVFKMAMDAAGFIGEMGKQVAISGAEAQEYTHFLRQRYHSILVGAQTVLVDDPHLGVRKGSFYQGARDPLRILFDPQLRLPKTAQVFRDENFLLVTTLENEKKAEQKFGERIVSAPVLSSGYFDLKNLLQQLYERGVPSILLEGGRKTAEIFMKQQQVQKAYFFRSKEQKVFANGITGFDPEKLNGFTVEERRDFSDDTMFTGIFPESF